MALNWNIEDCANVEAIKADTPDGWPVTDCAIWLCMIVGIGSITEKNAEAFWRRVHAWETITGPINTSGRRMEPADITRRIGLGTNASPLAETAWRKKLAETMARDADAAWRRTSGGMVTRAQLDAEAEQ